MSGRKCVVLLYSLIDASYSPSITISSHKLSTITTTKGNFVDVVLQYSTKILQPTHANQEKQFVMSISIDIPRQKNLRASYTAIHKTETI